MDQLEVVLFVRWGADGLPEVADDAETDDLDEVFLEIKSAEAAASGDDLRDVLNALTGELKAQFATFRRLRLAAETVLDAADGDEGAVKLAKADLKASTDAISLIVRTLEKVDNLQRSLADARALEADALVTEADVVAMRDKFLGLIEERAEELAQRITGENGAGVARENSQVPDPGG